jgi:hypothetical protein
MCRFVFVLLVSFQCLSGGALAQECYRTHEVLAITITKYYLGEVAKGGACGIITGDSGFADRVRNALELLDNQTAPFLARSKDAYRRIFGEGWEQVYDEDSDYFISNTKKMILDSWHKKDCDSFRTLIEVIELNPLGSWNNIFLDISRNFEKDLKIYLICPK